MLGATTRIKLRPLRGRLPCFVVGAACSSIRHLQGRQPSHVSSWNAMLSDQEKAVAHYAQMLREGVRPDMHTYPLLLKSLSASGSKSPHPIHTQILKLGLHSDPFVRNALVSSYAKCGDLGSARVLFDGMLGRDIVSWTAMVHGYVKNGRAGEGLGLFLEMRREGLQVDGVMVVSALGAAVVFGDVWLGRCIHGFYVECGRVRWDVYVGSALVDMYAKCGHCDDARKVFEEMPWRNVVSWSTLVAGYVWCSRFTDALFIFRDMLVEGLKANLVTLASVLSACAQLGALYQGRWVHHYIERNDLGSNSIIGTALIDMYAKCGCIDNAITIFNELSGKDVFPWTALINGLAMHGRADECLDFFSIMLKKSVKPNEVTFIGVLSACSHRGLVDEGRSYFDSMRQEFLMEPKIEHYGCMVDLLGRAGRIEEALSLINNMPMEPGADVWGTLFGACVIHNYHALGERIGKYLVEVQPFHDSKYALLANTYALSQNWKEVANVRVTMKGRKVEKTRGCSWLEVKGVLHEFLALDESHSQSVDIYHALEELTVLMKSEGYVPSPLGSILN